MKQYLKKLRQARKAIRSILGHDFGQEKTMAQARQAGKYQGLSIALKHWDKLQPKSVIEYRPNDNGLNAVEIEVHLTEGEAAINHLNNDRWVKIGKNSEIIISLDNHPPQPESGCFLLQADCQGDELNFYVTHEELRALGRMFTELADDLTVEVENVT